MNKNLLNPSATEALTKRVQALQPTTAPLWGQMTATEMLHHCNKVHQQLLAPAQPSGKGTTLKQYLTRWAVLYALPRFPKGAQAPKKFHTKGTINAAEFESEKAAFVSLLQRLGQYKGAIAHWHPYFGKLSTHQWGLTSWKHVDHHLRQFGV